jgi:hypothetical protein
MPKAFPASWLLIGTMTLAAPELGAESSTIEKLRARLKSPDQYGTECCQLLSLPAAAFVPNSSSASPFFEAHLYGYLEFRNSLWAPVVLPTGAVLDNIDLYYWDGFERKTCATLWAYTGPTLFGGEPGQSLIGSVCSPGVGGEYGYAIEELSGTIDNSVWFSGGAQYVVTIEGQGGGTDVGTFKGVTIWWHREVGPPPGTATFNDVPTSHPQFQFIEALAESGITVGCGGGNYCPENPLTRGQMAVFLAKALGLYWPF